MTVNRRMPTVVVIIAVVLIAVLGITEWQRSVATKKLLAELPGTDYSKVLDAMTQLKERGHGITPALLEDLKNQTPPAKWRAATLLGDVGTKAAWGPLTEALKDASPEVRAAAALALGKLKATTSAADLRARVTDAQEVVTVRCAAVQALALMHDREATRSFETILGDKAEALAAAAAAEAKKAEDKRKADEAKAEADEIARLKAAGLPLPPPKPKAPEPAGPKPPEDKSWEVRMACAQALGILGDPKSLSVMLDSLDVTKEPQVEVRVAAAYGLGDLARRIQDEATSTVLINGLIKAQEDKVGDVRAAAIHSLSFAFVPKAAQPIIADALNKSLSDDFYWAREAAKETAKALSIPVEG